MPPVQSCYLALNGWHARAEWRSAATAGPETRDGEEAAANAVTEPPAKPEAYDAHEGERVAHMSFP